MSRSSTALKLTAAALAAPALLMLSGCKKPPPQGACCSPDGSCVVSTQATCNGSWNAAADQKNFASACSPNPCPQPPPPPPALVALDTIAQDLKADARVQFAPDLKVEESQLELGKAIVKLADAIARGDEKTLKPMLTRRPQNLLEQLQSSGEWEEATKQIEAVRVVFVRDGVTFTAVGQAKVPGDEVNATLMGKITELLKDLPPEQLAAISKAATEALAGADPAKLMTDPAKLAELQTKLTDAAKAAGLSEEAIAKLASLGQDAAPDQGSAPSGGSSGMGVLLAVQDIQGAYLLGWSAENVNGAWLFTNAPATSEIKPRASLWDGVGAEAFQAVQLAVAPAVVPLTPDEPSKGGGGGGSRGGGGGEGAPPSSPPSSPPSNPPPVSPPPRAPGSPGRPPGSPG